MIEQRKFKSVNPATGETIEEFDFATEEEASETIAGARSAFQLWQKKDVSERTGYLVKVAEKLTERKHDFAKVITLEMGKPIKESLAEVEKCAWALNYFASNAKEMLEDQIIKTEASKSYVAFEPLGTIFTIMPWNFHSGKLFVAQLQHLQLET